MRRQYLWAGVALLASGMICVYVVWHTSVPHKRFEPDKDPVVLRGRNVRGVLSMRGGGDTIFHAPVGKEMLEDLISIILGPESEMNASFLQASSYTATIELSSETGHYVLECHPFILVDRGTGYIRLWNSSGAYAMTEAHISLDSSKFTADDVKSLASVWEKRAIELKNAKK